MQLEVSKIVEELGRSVQVYQRLQNSYSCWCDTNQPLRVHVMMWQQFNSGVFKAINYTSPRLGALATLLAVTRLNTSCSQ